MNTRKVDVVVVGAGIMGASAAWHLARSGHKVALLEQFDLDHVRGSSHGSSRIFRLAYDEPDYVRLAQSALPLWREAEKLLGKELLWTTGGVDLGPPAHLEQVEHALSINDATFEHVTRQDAERRFPWFRLPDGWEVVYHPDAGILAADACRQGFTQLAGDAGADVQVNTRVDRLLPNGENVTVETSTGQWSAEHVVLATAGWTNRLIEPLGFEVPLKVTREHVAYFPYAEEPSPLPWICHAGASSFDFYGLPNWRRQELKVGKHAVGPEVDPDSEAEIEHERIAVVSDFVRERLPMCSPEPVRSETCLYACTPDDDFVLDRVGRIVLGMGFGGHGYKFGAIIGSLLADLIRGQPVPFSSRFSHARFGALSASSRTSMS